jgi:hypothetical protein
MQIAIDYDGTFKSSSCYDDVEFNMWSDIVRSFLDAGHEVVIVTMRAEEYATGEVEKYLEKFSGCDLKVIYCGEKGTKKEVCRSKGYHIGIWIDDNPSSIE